MAVPDTAPTVERPLGGHPLDNAGWHALNGPHARHAQVHGAARKYPDDMSPFFAIDDGTDEAWADLAALAGRTPIVLFRGDAPAPPADWRVPLRGQGHQMTVERLAAPRATATVVPLTPGHVDDMLALVALTKPGPFERRTIELGDYHGVFDGDRLVAMAGERFRLPGHSEISAVCTHPDAQGRGLGEVLTHHVARRIVARGEQPFLHVVDTNHVARRVYERLGFTTRRLVDFVVLQPPRPGAPA